MGGFVVDAFSWIAVCGLTTAVWIVTVGSTRDANRVFHDPSLVRQLNFWPAWVYMLGAATLVVHFGVVLFLSALISAPWKGIGPVAVLWGLTGLFGVMYEIIVVRRLRTQTAYKPVFEDWLFHVLLPLVSYATVGASACASGSHPRPALFLVAGAGLLLLFVGIHNAWDTVTYHVFVRKRQSRDAPGRAESKE